MILDKRVSSDLARLENEDDGRLIALAYVAPELFLRTPQRVRQGRIRWFKLAAAFAFARVGPSEQEVSDPNLAKRCAGAYSLAQYRESVRKKANLVSADGLTVDIDGGADVDRLAEAEIVREHTCIIHETFKSTPSSKRARIVFKGADGANVETYEKAHFVVRAELRRAGFEDIDEAAKDASRLNFVPVRRPGAGYVVRFICGRPLDMHALAARLPLPPKPHPKAPAPARVYEKQEARGRISEDPGREMRIASGAISDVYQKIRQARPGTRHDTLLREVCPLGRFPLDENVFVDEFLPAWDEACPGESAEGERLIRAAIRAHRRGTGS
jgi:hypothetical protein